MPEPADVVVIGAGQAGLSVSHELQRQGVPHLVLERGAIAQTWRQRWDSFCLVLPNWTLRLPGHDYQGPESDDMLRNDLVAFLESYAHGFGAPVRQGVEVHSLLARDGTGRFELETSEGVLQASSAVLAAGAYQRSHRPPRAAELPARIAVFDAGS
jgi:putative flavoprotein involved in K+ transport